MEFSKEFLDSFQVIIGLITIGALLVAVYQLKLTKEANFVSIFNKIYDDNKAIIATEFEALTQLRIINRELNQLKKTKADNQHFLGNLLLTNSFQKFNSLYILIYHYEHVGLLVKMRMISFDLVFSLIAFPDTIWLEGQDIVAFMRENAYPDFLQNFEFLYHMYQEERKRREYYWKNLISKSP